MTIYLVRHASAGSRGSYADDGERPLDAVGTDQASAIKTQLSSMHEVQRILSSPAVRCVQTVEPLAAALGLSVEPHPALAEGQSARPALALIDALAGAHTAAVLCSHGDIIPATLRSLENLGVPLHGSRCPKGSIWELQVTDGAVSEATYRAFAPG